MDLNVSAQKVSNGGDSNGLDKGALREESEHPFGKSSQAFRTISEVSEEIDVPQHVLRFWESKFSQIRPLKRGGGRRYYRPEDIELLRRIKNYLYKQGYTIKGVQRLLKEKRCETGSHFAPYASPLHAEPVANLPGFPFEQALQQASALSVSSYLQAASVAPSALAMAYGAIGGQIAEHAGRHHFGDAFEQSTALVKEQIAADQVSNDQIEKTLSIVTQIHSEIASSVQPIRIVNPSAPRLEDMGLEDMDVEEQGMEAVDPEELNQNAEEEGAGAPLEVVAEDLVVELGAFEEIVFDYVPAPRSESSLVVQAAPALAPEKREQLCGLLAEITALRDMLRVEGNSLAA